MGRGRPASGLARGAAPGRATSLLFSTALPDSRGWALPPGVGRRGTSFSSRSESPLGLPPSSLAYLHRVGLVVGSLPTPCCSKACLVALQSRTAERASALLALAGPGAGVLLPCPDAFLCPFPAPSRPSAGGVAAAALRGNGWPSRPMADVLPPFQPHRKGLTDLPPEEIEPKWLWMMMIDRKSTRPNSSYS